MRTVRPPVTRLLTKELVGHVGEFSTLTPRPKLTHGYSRRATYALPGVAAIEVLRSAFWT